MFPVSTVFLLTSFDCSAVICVYKKLMLHCTFSSSTFSLSGVSRGIVHSSVCFYTQMLADAQSLGAGFHLEYGDIFDPAYLVKMESPEKELLLCAVITFIMCRQISLCVYMLHAKGKGSDQICPNAQADPQIQDQKILFAKTSASCCRMSEIIYCF